MQIYVAHSRAFDFQNELYAPLRSSVLSDNHTIVLPHESSDKPLNSLELFKTGCDFFVAEVSYPSTGLGIELGWASRLNIPIIAVYQHNQKPSRSVKAVTDTVLPYKDAEELVSILQHHTTRFERSS